MRISFHPIPPVSIALPLSTAVPQLHSVTSLAIVEFLAVKASAFSLVLGMGVLEGKSSTEIAVDMKTLFPPAYLVNYSALNTNANAWEL